MVEDSAKEVGGRGRCVTQKRRTELRACLCGCVVSDVALASGKLGGVSRSFVTISI